MAVSTMMINVAGTLSDNDSMEEVPDWGKADMEKLRDELSRVDWEEDFKGLDSEQSWERFKEKLLKAQELAVPMKRRRVSNRPVWMNMNTLRIIRKKRRLWRVYKDSKDLYVRFALSSSFYLVDKLGSKNYGSCSLICSTSVV